MSSQDERLAKAGPGVAGEVIGSLVALFGPVSLLMNLVNAYGFLAPSTPEPRHTIFYAVVAAIMLTGVTWAFVSARRRNARIITYIWHVLVGIWAVVAIVLLIVPQVDWRSLNDPPPVEQNVDYNPCYSGGDPCG
jgi:Na+-transporting NADH:ubiquinone oxidoreductase subunit NqrB